ncbi:MAG: hypothetical protein P4L49_15925 [Desulfosporosinus sp.]|nr:hypothetical protein [Desulfosporosinus sp.]
MGGNPIAFDYNVLAMLPMLFFFIFFLLALYLMVKTIRFYNQKLALDKELLQKFDELIKVQTQQSTK